MRERVYTDDFRLVLEHDENNFNEALMEFHEFEQFSGLHSNFDQSSFGNYELAAISWFQPQQRTCLE